MAVSASAGGGSASTVQTAEACAPATSTGPPASAPSNPSSRPPPNVFAATASPSGPDDPVEAGEDIAARSVVVDGAPPDRSVTGETTMTTSAVAVRPPASTTVYVNRSLPEKPCDGV